VAALRKKCDDALDSLESVRLALGVSRIDFARWRDAGFPLREAAGLDEVDLRVVKMIDDLSLYLEK
jgi:hypothetical protein